jgi:PEP-CTERM motif
MKKDILSLLTLTAITLTLTVTAHASVLFDNTQNTLNGGDSIANGQLRATKFLTGNDPYTVTSITLKMINFNGTSATVDIRSGVSDPGTFPDLLIGTLTSPELYPSDWTTLPLPVFTTTGITLQPNSYYWVVLGGDGFAWGYTDNKTGTGYIDENAVGHPDWYYSFSNVKYQMEVNDATASTVPEPTTYALLCIGLGVVGYARKKMHE